MEHMVEYIGYQFTLETPRGPFLVKVTYRQRDTLVQLIRVKTDIPL